jgi:hypothetical protein
MDLRDILKRMNEHGSGHGQHDDHNHGHGQGYDNHQDHDNYGQNQLRRHGNSHHDDSLQKYMPYIKSLLQGSKKLLIGLIILGVILFIIFIVAIVLLFPVLMHALEYISANGINGIIDLITRIVNGAGK